MVQVRIKRVYEDFSETDGYRVLVDKLWPRGIKKEWLKYDYWAKDITPSAALRRWFHEDIPGHWNDFVVMYQKELEASQAVADFLTLIKPHLVITLLYASKEPVYNGSTYRVGIRPTDLRSDAFSQIPRTRKLWRLYPFL